MLWLTQNTSFSNRAGKPLVAGFPGMKDKAQSDRSLVIPAPGLARSHSHSHSFEQIAKRLA